jgi:serine protease Do
VVIGDRAKSLAAANRNAPGDDENENPSAPDTTQSKLGIQVGDLPQNAPAGLHGVLIQSVKPGSFADEINMPQGFVIVAVNRQPVHNADEFRKIISGLKSGSDVAFEIVDPRSPHAGSNYVGGTLP